MSLWSHISISFTFLIWIGDINNYWTYYTHCIKSRSVSGRTHISNRIPIFGTISLHKTSTCLKNPAEVYATATFLSTNQKTADQSKINAVMSWTMSDMVKYKGSEL